MAIYVNLHFDSTYANVILQRVFIPELKEYVRHVDWINWDVTSFNKGASMITINGNLEDKSNDKHLERTYVFLQRIKENYGGIDIYVRDGRQDEWEEYKPSKVYTNDELIKVEQERWSTNYDTEIKYCEKGIERYKDFLSDIDETDPKYKRWEDELNFHIERLNSTLKKEQDRLKAIETIWISSNDEEELPREWMTLRDI